MGQASDHNRAGRVAEGRARDQRVGKSVGSSASAIVVLLVLAPSVYRLISGPVQWYDAVFVTVGAGLIAFHAVRLVRLRRRAAHTPAGRADS